MMIKAAAHLPRLGDRFAKARPMPPYVLCPMCLAKQVSFVASCTYIWMPKLLFLEPFLPTVLAFCLLYRQLDDVELRKSSTYHIEIAMLAAGNVLIYFHIIEYSLSLQGSRPK